MNHEERTRACIYCGDTYKRGSFHHCQNDKIIGPMGTVVSELSYNKVMEKQRRLVTPLAQDDEPKPVEWPMAPGDVNLDIVRYINELHEMILDMSLRISDLEEERVQ